MRGSSIHRRLTLVTLCAATVVTGLFAGPVSANPPATAHAAGEDSPWPRTKALRPQVRAARRELNRLARQVELMEISVARYDDWESCLRHIPVSEYGDPWFNRFGYLYDAREGTGVGYMDAIAIDRNSRPRREDYMFMDFNRSGCRSKGPQPGGTAEPASMRRPLARKDGLQPLHWPPERRPSEEPPRDPSASASKRTWRPGLKGQTTRLMRKAKRLFRRAQVIERATERFDEWESCVSWVPVTEQGGWDRKFGYLYGRVGERPGFMPALHIDRSDWDDPDYMFLALVGGDRPGKSCQDEPGEGID